MPRLIGTLSERWGTYTKDNSEVGLRACYRVISLSWCVENLGTATGRNEENKARGGERRAVPTTNLKFRNSNCQDDDDVAFCLIVISARCFGTEAVHLRSTNLSIVSRQISRNITNIFRYRTPRIPVCSVEARLVLDYLNIGWRHKQYSLYRALDI